MHRQGSGRPTRVHLVASGDQRESANRMCWPAQRDMEARLTAAFAQHGVEVVRAHAFDAGKGHGFLDSQRAGMDVLSSVPDDAWVVVAVAAWQYSHHLLAGLLDRQAPILTVANWSGAWPGLVGLLNLNACLTKAGKPYATLWSETFEDAAFGARLDHWLLHGCIEHDDAHVHRFDPDRAPTQARELGQTLAADLRRNKAIIGVLDEGCMGMSNAILEDGLLNPMGIFKERLSQSALLAEMRSVADQEAEAVIAWLRGRGMRFELGEDEDEHLTEAQLREQGRMYVAAVRLADRFGCDAIGIQYQQGLKDMAPASDLVEGLLNDADRPPVRRAEDGQELYPGRPLTHFNEVDECAAVDGLVTDRIWRRLGFDPSNTLHDLRWGEDYDLDGSTAFLWTLQISGAVPASHLEGGYAGATGYRQPAMYFPWGGSTLSGVCRPGELVWSRVFVQDGRLHADLGRGRALRLPEAETERRRRSTTYAWPILHAALDGVSRDQMMARHKSNHLQVAYAPEAAGADLALAAKAAAFHAMGLEVHLCGVGQP